MASEQPLVICHAACYDGTTSAWVAHKFFMEKGINPEIVFASYGNEFTYDVKDREVYIIDFSYPRDVLLDIQRKAKHLVVLDHHKTAKEALEGLKFCIFDMAKSGAMLAWEAFFPGLEAPPIVKYMQDYDLWQFKLYKSKEFHAYVNTLDKTKIETIEFLHREFGERFNERAAQGEFILGYNAKLTKQACKYPFWININGFVVLAAYGMSDLKNEIGEELAKMNTETSVGVCISTTVDGKVSMSFRATGYGNAEQVSRSMGFGGHKTASGGAMTYAHWSEVLAKATPYVTESILKK